MARETAHSDEEICNCTEVTTSTKHCKIIVKRTNDKPLYSSLYKMGKDGICTHYRRKEPCTTRNPTSNVLKKSHEEEEVEEEEEDLFVCMNGLALDLAMADDLFADCSPIGEDEPSLLALLYNQYQFPCTNPVKIPCVLGHPRCFKIEELCTYRLDKSHHMLPCRNGGHLNSCNKFECNMMSKCPGYYCIPFTLLCDGKLDCPTGEDESSNCSNVYKCQNLFKCMQTQAFCIHPGLVCNGVKDCSFNDDELFCELRNVRCPFHCNCLALAFLCAKTNTTFLHHFPYIAVTLTFSVIDLLGFFLNLPKLEFLLLKYNEIKVLCHTGFSKNLQVMDDQFNPIRKLSKQCFQTTKCLEYVVLSHNKIAEIESDSFDHVQRIKLLNLSNNYLITLPKKLFMSQDEIDTLSFLNNSLQFIDVKVFEGIHITFIETDDYHICCVAPENAQCSAHRPWYISCSDLLPKFSLEVTFVAASTTIISLTLFSSLLHVKSKQYNTAYFRLLLSANVNDACLGLYLCAIWTQNYHLKGIFSVCEFVWRSSDICFTAFGIFLCFALLSPCHLLNLSFARMQVVRFPVETKFKQNAFITRNILCLFVSGCLVTVAITSVTELVYTLLPFCMCHPFVDPSKKVKVLKVTTWITAIHQIMTSLAIIITHSILIKKEKKSKKTRRSSKTENSRYHLTLQLVTITTSNLLCWIPSSLVYIICMFQSTYPPSMIFWTTVVVVPINSIIHPLVFTITSLRSLHRKHAKMETQSKQNKICCL